MRTFEEAKRSWHEFTSYPTISDLRNGVRNQGTRPSALSGSRSLCWKSFLLFEGSDRTEWLKRSSDSRSAYTIVRNHLLRGLEHPEEASLDVDPLSEDLESPWAVLRNDEALRTEILQDVDRCMPDNVFFRQPETQRMLLDILFVYCKLNPDVGYRQGMHELLAPILWVIEKDAICPKPSGMLTTDHELLGHICNSDFIENDAFTLFAIVMQGAKSFYEQAAHESPSMLATAGGPASKLENPIITRINRIYTEYLPHVDPKLAQHLQSIDLIPQVFLMRWIRLLFGREFSFDDVLSMWDAIFAEDPSLDIVDLICVTMILRLHWDLIEEDYNIVLTSLLRYPEMPEGTSPQALVIDAVYLRDHFDTVGASELVEKYSGRPLPIPELPEIPDPLGAASVPSSLQAFGARLQAARPSRGRNASGNLESILQNTAKDIFSRSEKWGINRAVRDAMDEVRRGVRDIQAMQTPQAPRLPGMNRPQPSQSTNRESGESNAKLAALEKRNAELAKMLKNATDELWKYHEDAASTTADKDSDESKLKDLSIAIAKVQFTQVYLEDSTLPLPTDEAIPSDVAADGTKEAGTSTAKAETSPQDEDQPPAVQSIVAQAAKIDPESSKTPSSATSANSAQAHKTKLSSSVDNPKDFQTPRPSLAQSSFSWMLGQSDTANAFATNSFMSPQEHPPSEARRRSRGFLFGDEDAKSTRGRSGSAGSASNGGKKAKEKTKLKKHSPRSELLFDQDMNGSREEIDLGALEEEKAAEKEKRKVKDNQ